MDPPTTTNTVSTIGFTMTTARLLLRHNTGIVPFHRLALSRTIPSQSRSLITLHRNPWNRLQCHSQAFFSTQPSGKDEEDTNVDSSTPNSIEDDKSITARDYAKTISELSKARLSALVVATSSFGYLAAATPISYSTLVAASLGTALCSSSASALNQIFEQDRDSRMKRTAQRPLVTQKVFGTNGAYALAATTGLTGGATLYFGTDPITAALGVGNIALYAGAYTYMKPRSEWNTWVGAIVGAIPPVMGYIAATNGLGLFDIEAALLGGTLFLWQFPHFFALSWMHRLDYARGGFQVRHMTCYHAINNTHASILATERHSSR